MQLLTKSKYIAGLQCPKFIWTMFHHPEKIKEPDLNAQYRFDQGNLVGELAKKLYPKGINLATENFNENLQKTKELLKENRPLFEAGVIFENCFARIDILLPVK